MDEWKVCDILKPQLLIFQIKNEKLKISIEIVQEAKTIRYEIFKKRPRVS